MWKKFISPRNYSIFVRSSTGAHFFLYSNILFNWPESQRGFMLHIRKSESKSTVRKRQWKSTSFRLCCALCDDKFLIISFPSSSVSFSRVQATSLIYARASQRSILISPRRAAPHSYSLLNSSNLAQERIVCFGTIVYDTAQNCFISLARVGLQTTRVNFCPAEIIITSRATTKMTKMKEVNKTCGRIHNLIYLDRDGPRLTGIVAPHFSLRVFLLNLIWEINFDIIFE